MSSSTGAYDGFIQYGSHHFPDPFLDMASLAAPRSMVDLLRLSEFLWLKNGIYSAGAGRIVRYFVTDIEFDKPNDRLYKFLTRRLKVKESLILSGDNVLAYGNDFSSLFRPFRRFLRCKTCHRSEVPIENANWKFSGFKFIATCSKCRKDTEHTHIDRRSQEEDKFWIRHWNPHQILLRWHQCTGKYEYHWRIDPELRNEIQKGTKFYVANTPWEIIETVRRNEIFTFAPDMVYHMKERTLAGVRTAGWGLPRMLSNFSQAWYVQVLKRFNEALAMDYVMPFRAITPPPARTGQAGGVAGIDPIASIDYADFTSKVRRMLLDHRRDPARWHVLPFPVQYQALGGEAKMLAPKDLLDQGHDEFLNGIGLPANLYRLNLQEQAAPIMLRLFQQNWMSLTTDFDNWLEWITAQACAAQTWDVPESVRLQPVKFADDLEARQVWLQLASSNLLSRETAFSPWGVRAREEQKKIFKEQEEFEEMQRQFEEDKIKRQQLRDQLSGAQQQAGGMGMPLGAPGGTNSPQGAVTPSQRLDQAKQKAVEWASMPDSARRSDMLSTKNTDEVLWSLAKAQLQQIRQQASSQGQQMVMQQQFGGG